MPDGVGPRVVAVIVRDECDRCHCFLEEGEAAWYHGNGRLLCIPCARSLGMVD